MSSKLDPKSSASPEKDLIPEQEQTPVEKIPIPETDRSVDAVTLHNTESHSKDETITKQPKPSNGMSLDRDSSDRSSEDTSNCTSLADLDSGYDKNANECTEFCIECSTCFGMVESCCPSNGEGCLTNTLVFIGNILVGCFSKCGS